MAFNISNRLFLNILIFSVILTVCQCAKNASKSDVDDDSDFGISLLDGPTKDKKNNSNTNAALADAIVKAVQNFASDRRVRGFSLSSILAGAGLGNVFNARNKRSVSDLEKIVKTLPKELLGLPIQEASKNDGFTLDDPDFLSDLSDKLPTASERAENESLFKELHDDLEGNDSEFNKAFGDEDKKPVVYESNINKIPKKVVLSRQAKSIDNNLVKMKDANFIINSTSEEYFNDDDISTNGNITGIEQLLEVYSAKGMIDNWSGMKVSLSANCRREMGQYLRGLVVKKYWALKMDDASGRYSSGYYWGNAYWAGSATLCQHISTSTDAKAPKSSDDLTRNSYTLHETTDEMKELPPFNLSFFMAKVRINSTFVTGPKIIQVGLCLPDTCSGHDVHHILEMSSTVNKPEVLEVRDPNYEHYDMFSDLTFQILVGVSVTVLGLIIAGTLYELILTARVRKRSSKKNLKLNTAAGLPSVKLSNGKSIYNVNGITNNNNNSEERLNIEPHQVHEPMKLSIFSEMILSFSVISNMKTICDQSVGSDTIPTIHGLRTVSMVWVILGHSCILAFKYSDNTELRKVVEKEFLFQTVTNGAFSVDTFFCISGILVSYIYFRTNAKGSLERLTQGTRGFTSGILQFIGLLAYRFARLTAPYLFMLGVVEVSMKWFYHNSVFEPPTQDHINCPKYWWRNVLYINTLFPVDQMCMLWSWYLADDSQFYVLGAVILILAASHFKTAAGALVLFLISSWGTTGYIAWSNNHMPSTDDPLALFDKIYDKPWTRLGPYLIGMATGWLLFKTDCKIKMSKITVTIGWILSSGVLLCIIYGLYNTELTPISGAAYTSLSHTAWAIAIAWIVIACSTGYGGYVNSLLSATILYPFSRVTYCAYLVHPIVIRFLPMHMDHPIHLGKDMMTIIFLGQMVCSYILSFIISLAFEAPVVTMLKILAPNKRKHIQ